MDKKGFHLCNNDEYLDISSLGQQQLKLISSGDGIEIMIQEMMHTLPNSISGSLKPILA